MLRPRDIDDYRYLHKRVSGACALGAATHLIDCSTRYQKGYTGGVRNGKIFVYWITLIDMQIQKSPKSSDAVQ